MPSSAPSTSTNAANYGTEPGKGSTTGSPASTCVDRVGEGGGRRSAALNLLPHVPGNGDHSVPLERGDS